MGSMYCRWVLRRIALLAIIVSLSYARSTRTCSTLLLSKQVLLEEIDSMATNYSSLNLMEQDQLKEEVARKIILRIDDYYGLYCVHATHIVQAATNDGPAHELHHELHRIN